MKVTPGYTTLRTVTLACPLLVLTSVGFAETTDKEGSSEKELAPVVVTAQKIERSLQDTKESIAIVSSEDIDKLALFNLKDVFNATANVYSTGNGEAFGIRGVTHNSQSTGGGEGELASFYVDGVAYSGLATRFGFRNLWDVEQVEILRGPQSTNIGRNAMVGAVVVKTKRPELHVNSASVLVEAGTLNHRSVQGMVNLPLGNTTALRLTAEHLADDGAIENFTRNEDNTDSTRSQNVRAQFLYQPSEDLSINFMTQYVDGEYGYDALVLGQGFDIGDRKTGSNISEHETYDAYVASATVDYALNDQWSLTSVTSGLRGDYDRLNDDDGTAGGGDASISRERIDQNWAQELRFNYQSENLSGLIGVYLTEITVDNQTDRKVNLAVADQGVPPALLPFYPETIGVVTDDPLDQKTSNQAIFTEWDYRFADPFTLSFGFRYDIEEQKVDTASTRSLAEGESLPDPVAAGAQADALQPGSGAIVAGSVTQVNGLLESRLGTDDTPERDAKYEAFLPQLGLTYDISDDLAVSLFYKKGYRAGGAGNTGNGTEFEYDPEFLDNYELSFRSAWMDRRLIANANVYYSDWTDQQVLRCINGNIFDCPVENVGKSNLYGAEIETQFLISADAEIYFSVGYSQTEFVDYFVSESDGQGDVNEVDLGGNEFVNSPTLNSTLGGRVFLTQDIYVGGSVNYQDGTYADVENDRDLDSRTLLNVNAGYLGDDYTVELLGTNLTDDLYLTSNGFALNGDRRVTVGAPRQIIARLKLDF